MNYHSPIANVMVKVAKEKRYAPDILAHELGHSKLHGKSGLLMPVRSLAPMAGSISNIVTGTPYGLAGHLVPLADEAYASTKAMKTLKDWGIEESERKAAKKRFGLGFASYALGPTVDAGVTIGGLAAGSQDVASLGPMAGRLAEYALSSRIARQIDKVPVKGISKKRAKELSYKENPDVDVHFSRRPIPHRGMYVGKPILRPSEERIKGNPMYETLGAFIGSKASGKLLRKGGVVVSPTE